VNCSLTGSLLPEYSWNQRTTISHGSVDLSLLWRHISSMQQEPANATAAGFGSPALFNKIKAFNYFDLTMRAEVMENFEFTIAAINLFDKQPPMVGSNIGVTTFNSGNTFPQTYDAIGRRFAATAKIRF
jgi:outer membrane receptor protein involved in Fe transport